MLAPYFIRFDAYSYSNLETNIDWGAGEAGGSILFEKTKYMLNYYAKPQVSQQLLKMISGTYTPQKTDIKSLSVKLGAISKLS